jgi:hypothetical protein
MQPDAWWNLQVKWTGIYIYVTQHCRLQWHFIIFNENPQNRIGNEVYSILFINLPYEKCVAVSHTSRFLNHSLFLNWLCRSASILGEYRTIMNLVRVLPNGREAKLVVDEAIDRCAPIGNLRDDIHRWSSFLFLDYRAYNITLEHYARLLWIPKGLVCC